MPSSDLPFGSEFSPAQINLVTLLEMAYEYAEDWRAFERAVRDRYFAGHSTSDENKGKLANNTKLSMRAYGLIGEKDASLTDVGRKLYEIRHKEAALYEVFGCHIRDDIRPLLRKSLIEIRREIESGNNHIRGLALEALAFKLMRLIDLRYVATRLRGTATGGAEVDLLFEGKRLVFSRWQVQCKNTPSVSLDDVAKEVGLTHFLKSNVIVILSTGDITNEARRYANKIMMDSNLCIVVMNGEDLDNIEARPAAICDILNREADHAMALKKLEL